MYLVLYLFQVRVALYRRPWFLFYVQTVWRCAYPKYKYRYLYFLGSFVWRMHTIVFWNIVLVCILCYQVLSAYGIRDTTACAVVLVVVVYSVQSGTPTTQVHKYDASSVRPSCRHDLCVFLRFRYCTSQYCIVNPSMICMVLCAFPNFRTAKLLWWSFFSAFFTQSHESTAANASMFQ